MGTRLFSFLFILLTLKVLTFGDTTVTSENLYYSAYLPDNWQKVEFNDTVHIFKDTSKNYKSLIGIIRTTLDTMVYDSAEDWSRASFIAYKLFVEYTVDPSGAVFYYDSSKSSIQKDSLWAPELYSEFYSVDTALDSWAEYVRFAATDKYGYELFVLGDTLDMAINIGFYAAIVRSIIIDDSYNTAIDSYPSNLIKSSLVVNNQKIKYFYDPLGRKLKRDLIIDNRRSVRSGLLIGEDGRKLLLIK